MTQADILGKNQDPFLDPKSARPSGFTDSQFPDSIPNLSEQSPIRPSKYFASDRFRQNMLSLMLRELEADIFRFIYFYKTNVDWIKYDKLEN